MNVALEPASTSSASRIPDCSPERCGQHSEWIDPEGDDWFASIYRELTEESATTAVDQASSDLAYWFG
ncbi:MAG: hypothetical protein ABSE58_01430 [Candidatus Limnocylindrales bacterium]|jgi:hypothetical protein